MKKNQLILNEIELKGKAYIIILNAYRFNLRFIVMNLIKKAYKAGAKQVFISIKIPTNKRNQDMIKFGKYLLTFDSNMIYLKKELNPKKQDVYQLTLLKDNMIDTFIEYNNEAFYSVPNSATMSYESLKKKLNDDNMKIGFFVLEGVQIGTFEINLKDSIPEIASISILPKYQQQGHGKRCLASLEGFIANQGYNEVKLIVSTKNTVAYQMYLNNDYKQDYIYSKWYEVNKKAQ